MCSCRWKSCWFDSSGTLSQRLAATDLNHNDAHTNPQEVVCLRVRACVFLLIQVPSCFSFVLVAFFWAASLQEYEFSWRKLSHSPCFLWTLWQPAIPECISHSPRRCFVFPSRDCRSISEDSSSCRAEFRASTFTLRINQIDPVNWIRADWYSVNRHDLRAWARVSVLQVQCDRY